MNGPLIFTVFLITMLIILVIPAGIIIAYLININKDIKKLMRTTEKSSRDIADFSKVLSSISTPLMIFGAVTSIFTKFNKFNKKKGKR